MFLASCSIHEMECYLFLSAVGWLITNTNMGPMVIKKLRSMKLSSFIRFLRINVLNDHKKSK